MILQSPQPTQRSQLHTSASVPSVTGMPISA
jgi:hypothetical protein